MEFIDKQKGYIEGGYRFFYLEEEKKMHFDYHYHNFHKCLIVLEGKLNYEVEGVGYDLTGGDIIWVPSYEAHKVDVSGEVAYRRIVIYLSKLFVELLSTKLDLAILQIGDTISHSLKLSKKDLEALQCIFPHLEIMSSPHISVENDMSFDHRLVTIHKFIEWMNYYFAIVKNQQKDEYLIHHNNLKIKEQWVLKTMAYIKKHFREPLTIDEVAKQVYLSKYYFMRKFKEIVGMSIHQYLNQQRLVHARYLMKQGISLTEIAFSSGFRDYSTFARAFKNTYKKSPREFQKLDPSLNFD